jgi:hypothetical protein
MVGHLIDASRFGGCEFVAVMADATGAGLLANER